MSRCQVRESVGQSFIGAGCIRCVRFGMLNAVPLPQRWNRPPLNQEDEFRSEQKKGLV